MNQTHHVWLRRPESVSAAGAVIATAFETVSWIFGSGALNTVNLAGCAFYFAAGKLHALRSLAFRPIWWQLGTCLSASV